MSADAAAQQSLAQSLDVNHHALVGLLHFGHGMSFQTQLFSDKGFYEHLGSGPFVFFGRNNELNPMPGCRSNAARSQLQAFKGLLLSLHFLESNPFFPPILQIDLRAIGARTSIRADQVEEGSRVSAG